MGVVDVHVKAIAEAIDEPAAYNQVFNIGADTPWRWVLQRGKNDKVPVIQFGFKAGQYGIQAGVDGDPLRFETASGVYGADVGDTAGLQRVRLFFPEGFKGSVGDMQTLSVGGGAYEVVRVWSGTEHAVIRVSDTDDVDVEAVGRVIRRHEIFEPMGTNVDFLSADDGEEGDHEVVVRARTYERGVEAETLSCGTGAVACALHAWNDASNAPSRPIRVRMRGGVLTVGQSTFDGTERLYLEGPVQVVYRGTIEL